jgi:hypothetical protein
MDGRGMLSSRRTRDAGQGNLAIGSASEPGDASGQGSRRRAMQLCFADSLSQF